MTSGAGTSAMGPTLLATWRTQPRQICSCSRCAEVMRIADHAALGAAQRDVDDGALPGHPHRQRANGVDGLLRVEADAALARAARIVVLHAEAAEDLYASVVHVARDGEVELTQRIAQKLAGSRIKTQVFSDFVELCLRDLKGIQSLTLLRGRRCFFRGAHFRCGDFRHIASPISYECVTEYRAPGECGTQ